MTGQEFLDQEEALAKRSLASATQRMGDELQKVVDVPGLVRRRPYLSLGTGTAAGFVLGRIIRGSSRGMMRRGLRIILVPLVRPTLAGLGTAIAGMMLGEPERRR
jgi:hypothetical protein